MSNTQNTEEVKAPSLKNFLLEGRIPFEWASSCLISPLISKQAEGDKRPVFVFPPLLTNDFATQYLRRFLDKQGFSTYKWCNGINLAHTDHLPGLESKLQEIYDTHDQKVSIVGWSAGGFFARVLANKHPELVEQIITIATPFRNLKEGKTNLDFVFEAVHGKKKTELDNDLVEWIEATPDVPITCIYSKSDGIVPWQNCRENIKRDNIQEVEVYGSHGGLGANPSVLIYVAKILAYEHKNAFTNNLPVGFSRILYPGFWQRGIEKPS